MDGVLVFVRTSTPYKRKSNAKWGEVAPLPKVKNQAWQQRK